MPLITVRAGDLAKAADFNNNIQFLLGLIGEQSTPERGSPPEFLLGARKSSLFTASHDTGPLDDRRSVIITWNADLNYVDPDYVFSRLFENETASAIEIGAGGIAFLVTSRTTGNLNSQLGAAMRIVATTGEDRIVVGPNWHFQTYNGIARNVQDYRLDTVWMQTAVPIYEGKSLSKATDVIDVSEYGVPTSAKAVIINAWATRTSSPSAQFRFYREGGPGNRNKKYGFFLSLHPNEEQSAQGFVPLGEGTYENKLVIDRSEALSGAYAYIIGYQL